LKEDGKTVGYLKIQGGILQGSKDGLEWRYITNQNPAGDLKLSDDEWIHFFNTAHPFVTQDKNGKDVFAGDKVISSDGLRKYKVIWDERRWRWWLCGIDKSWAVNDPIWQDYELIEEKKDE
ncbi:unnamed protein product, partial [marine sediment metagenome]